MLSVVAGQVDADISTLEDLAAVLAGDAVVVVLDPYERFGLVDDWVRNALVPALPASAVTIIVGRNAPNAAWRTTPGWRDITAELVVGPMTEPDAAALVARREQRADVIAKVLRFGRGHPLALELAASAFARHPELEIGDGPPPEVVEELLDVLLADLDPATREIVEVAAMLRRVTTPMLAAILDGDPTAAVDDAWRTCAACPSCTSAATAWSSTASSMTCCPPVSSSASRAALGDPASRGPGGDGRDRAGAGLGRHRRPVAPRAEPDRPLHVHPAARATARDRGGPAGRSWRRPRLGRSGRRTSPRRGARSLVGRPPDAFVCCAATTAGCGASPRCAVRPDRRPCRRRPVVAAIADDLRSRRWRPVSPRSWCAGCSRARAAS